MDPTALGMDAYSASLVAATIAGTAVTLALGRRAGLGVARFLLFQAMIAVAGLAGAKAYSVLERGGLHGLAAALDVPGGFRYPGGLLAAAAVAPLALRLSRLPVNLLAVADLSAPGIGVAMAIARVGCLLEGCCYGVVTAVPWGIRFARFSPAWGGHLSLGLIGAEATESLPVHPLQVYLGLWSLVVAALVTLVLVRKRYAGQAFLAFVLLHEGGKGLLEGLRGPEPLWHLQSISIGLAIAAGVALILAARPWRVRTPVAVGRP